MTARIWVYNYDFDFELAGIQAIRFGLLQPSPWYFLNRAAAFLIPFANDSDCIVTYQKPPESILKSLKAKLGLSPRFVELPSTLDHETNSVLADIEKGRTFPIETERYSLSPWGWSAKAIDCAVKHFANQINPDFANAVMLANSKQTSDWIRNQLLAPSFAIPSLQVTDKTLAGRALKDLITLFISQHPCCKIKHYFGASGKLTDTVDLNSLTRKKLLKWQTWIAQSGGLIIEKQLTIASEFSIQAEIGADGDITPIALTQLYSHGNGSYLGNLIDPLLQPNLADWMLHLRPLFTHLAKLGYRGPIGLDLCNTNQQQTKLLEINARLTMGRVAYQWYKAVRENRLGFFTNFFMKDAGNTTLDNFLQRCSDLENRYDCLITPINFISSKENGSSLVSLLIGANNKITIQKALRQIHEKLFENFRL